MINPLKRLRLDPIIQQYKALEKEKTRAKRDTGVYGAGEKGGRHRPRTDRSHLKCDAVTFYAENRKLV